MRRTLRRGVVPTSIAALAACAGRPVARAAPDALPLHDIVARVDAGRFAEADRAIDAALPDSVVPYPMRDALAYRIAFNGAISMPFDPPRRYVRPETADSHRGEAEWCGGPLYFDQWGYAFQA